MAYDYRMAARAVSGNADFCEVAATTFHAVGLHYEAERDDHCQRRSVDRVPSAAHDLAELGRRLQQTTEHIKARTMHLKGLKIGVMGCIVNGPGEMADADFGYVGGAPGKVNLFKGQECVRRGVPTGEAVEALVELIKQHGRWVELE